MIQPIYPTEESLTGRIRHRAGWLGHQILQVEISTRPYRDIPDRPPSTGWHRAHYGPATTSWRDATILDSQALVSRGFAGLAPGYDKAGCPLAEPRRHEWVA